MGHYLRNLESELQVQKLRVMQSNGGSVGIESIADRPVRTIVSGPAGGVVGAFHLAENCGYSQIITFDMGGTSTDVALCDGEIKVTNESQVDCMPIGVPMIDIHTVGAGGGSIASLDPGGALRVGPESAGAEPGPICYGRGRRLTVTDANVLLGRLLPRFFLGGQAKLETERIPDLLRKQEWTSAWAGLEALAQGVVDVVNNNMEQAIRLISVERGYDPRDFALFCFGGAGGLHAAHLARGLGIPRVVVPPFPGALSALGLLLADARRDYSRTLLTGAAGAHKRIRKILSQLHRQGQLDLIREGFERAEILHSDFVDVRYVGQSYELTVPFTTDFEECFHAAHERRYGYSNPGKSMEIVNVRTTFLGKTQKPEFPRRPMRRRSPEPAGATRTWFEGRAAKTDVYDRTSLWPGCTFSGPAIIGEYSSTTVVPPGVRCTVDGYSNLVLEIQ
jgi:N-methylhydantoinase A